MSRGNWKLSLCLSLPFSFSRYFSPSLPKSGAYILGVQVWVVDITSNGRFLEGTSCLKCRPRGKLFFSGPEGDLPGAPGGGGSLTVSAGVIPASGSRLIPDGVPRCQEPPPLHDGWPSRTGSSPPSPNLLEVNHSRKSGSCFSKQDAQPHRLRGPNSQGKVLKLLCPP